MSLNPNRLKGIVTSSFLLLLINCGFLEAQVKLSEQEWVIPTYKVDPPDKNPMFFKGESYQGASKYIYPYGLNDVISNEKEDKAWKALILENEYIKLCVTPEIGGKLYYGTDKTNGYNFIYKNTVVKPSNIGMLGAWVSGGIEWCVIHHHRASTFLPVDYALADNEDGSKTIWIGETEPRHRMRWTIGITAYPGKSYYSADVKIHNPTPFTHTFLYWANVAAHTNKDYQVVFPPSVKVATYHAKNSFTNWPFSTEVYNHQDFTKGVDLSWWINSPNSNSYFAYDLKEDFMGGYDHGKETGTVHIGDHNIVKGAKLWEWGSGARGQATEGRLTENDGPYVEIMVGAFSDNQPDYSWIQPYEVKTFRQYWYPVKDIKGFKNANLQGAVNLEKQDNNKVFLGYYSTELIKKARIVLRNKGSVIFDKTVEISPDIAFTQSISVPGTLIMTDLYTEMTNAENNKVLVSYQPVEYNKPDELPETVKRPESPEDIKTVEELYLTGKRIQQFYNPTMDEMDYFREALKRDPDDIRTNTAVGNRYLLAGDYVSARRYLTRAIKRLTKDYTRPSDCEALYLEGLTLKALGLYDEATDTLYRATWDYKWHSAAYLELARISSINGDFRKALAQINESLSTNTGNNSSITFKAGIQRITGDYKGAEKTLETILTSDPLDLRASNESHLLALATGNQQLADKKLTQLNNKMRDLDQNYLETAVAYLNDGMINEAEDVLKRFKGKNPVIDYYLGYLADYKGKGKEAEIYFKTAKSQSVDNIFPFRLETIKVLETAIRKNPSDNKAYYYLGNILYDRQPEKAMEYWQKSVNADPSLAVAHRNLGWGYFNHYGDGYKAISEYEKALDLEKNEPIFYEELDALYEMSNASIDKRLKLFEGSNEISGKRDDTFARQISVLTLGGKPEKAVEYLSGRIFNYREGSSRVRDILIDAHLVLGIKQLKEKKYKEALENFLLAQVPDEEATGGRSGNRNIQIDYFIGLAYEALGNKTSAKKYFSQASEINSRSTDFLQYYKGMSYIKLGKKNEANEIFNSLITGGEQQISQGSARQTDFFAKFGAEQAENARLSDAYLLKGLGYKGLGEIKDATESLGKAIELSASNLFAKIELE